MGIRDQVRRAYYGAAIGNSQLDKTGLFVLPTNDDTTLAGVADPTTNQRALAPYILQKCYLAGRHFTQFWYFGRCLDADGAVIPGTARLRNYPLRIFDDAGNGGYGALCLGVQGEPGRIIVMGARASLTWSADNTNAVGTGLTVTSGNPNTDFAIGTATFATNNTHATLTTTKGDIINSTASDPTGTAAATAVYVGAGGVAAVAHSPVNTVITDSSGGTASPTFAALTATVTSTVVANALAQLAANENNRLGLFGKVIAGTSSVQSLFLNFIMDDGDQAATADNDCSGELLLNGVIEIHGRLDADI
jgi:hypothetical protein